ncbi:hypothetical protein FHT71_006412 [Rhizobium sp. BK060]|nr:hypothetical protein [Rhizobium sp. BK060]
MKELISRPPSQKKRWAVRRAHKYQVFVSSTFVDLQEERRSAIEAILNLGHIPVGMEAFQASDDTQWDYIKRRIDESDYYIVIVGERYGSEQDGKSYTQMEYEYAVANGVPVAAFLLDPSARKSWPSDKVEFEKRAKVESFRELCQQKLVKFWKNSDELGGRVALALNELMRQKPRSGWVRADTLPSKNVMDELASLSEERRRLQSVVEQLTAEKTSSAVSGETLLRMEELNSIDLAGFFGFSSEKELQYSLLDTFIDLSDVLSGQTNAADIEQELSKKVSFEMNADEVELLAFEFVKHDLVSAAGRRNSSSYVEFELTSYGKSFLLHAKRWRSLANSATD